MNRKIQYLGYLDWAGAHYVKFQIEGTCYVYQLSFPEWCKQVDGIARKYSPWKALNKAKKQATTWFRVNSSWPDQSTEDL
jgi:hypothetical protein